MKTVRSNAHSSVTVLVFVALVAGLAGCGDDKRPTRRGPKDYRDYKVAAGQRAPESTGGSGALASDDGEFGPASGSMPTTSAKEILAGGVAGAGSIKGVVTFKGDGPKPREFPIDKDPWCAANHKVFSDDFLVNDGGRFQNVTVFVSRGFNRFTFTPPDTAALLDQNGCIYVPHILTMMAGQELKVRNSDSTTHNYHFNGRANPEINKTQNKPTTDSVLDLANPELTGRFKCDVHFWMSAPVRIFAHPYYAVTNANGEFEIKGLPAGKYEVSFLHERGDVGAVTRSIEVAAGGTAQLDAEMVSAN